jgi:hypothetical protein
MQHVSVSTLEEYRALAEYDSVIKKRVAESWNPDQELILKAWAEKASGWAWLHDKSARYFSRLSNKIMYPSIILSTVSGGVGLSLYNSHSSNSRILTIIIGFFNIASASLVSLQKMLRSTEKGETHMNMHKLFSSYCRKIVMELALQPCDRRDCLEFCKACRDEYDNMVNDSPEIPACIISEFKKVFVGAKNVPEIANGLVHFHERHNQSSYHQPSKYLIERLQKLDQFGRKKNVDISDDQSKVDTSESDSPKPELSVSIPSNP